MNPVLADQLRRLGLSPDAAPTDVSAWQALLERVGRLYDDADRTGHLTDRSREMSPQATGDLYEELRSTWEAQMARSRRHYSNLFEESPIPTWEEDFSDVGVWLGELKSSGVTDLEAYFDEHPEAVSEVIGLIEVTDVNAAALDFLEAEKADVLGSFDTARFNEDSLRSYRKQFGAVWASTPRISYEITGQRASGVRLDAILHWSAPMLDGDLDLSKVIVAMVDISERIQAMQRMEELMRSKDDFLASVSHELRTPLTAVYGSAEALLDQWADLEDSVRLELVDFIARESGELADLVEDLLVAARADIGRVKLAPKQVMIRPLVAATVEIARLNSMGRTIEFGETDGEVYADPLRLKQIVRNLLTNAIRYGGQEIRVETKTAGDRVWISVLDNGDGVPLDRRESMFELYERAHDHEGPVGSVGVGLAVSRELAEQMGGSLVYDHNGAWSAFMLELPARPPSIPTIDPLAAAAS